ncbi:MAG TPA: hypothetical protein GX505_01280 [Clostridiales bacterium]|nr:hypothetical protein [Clostridiales bacterium]
MNRLDVLAQIGDIKEIEYRNTLAITSIIEVLLEKNIISREDISKKAEELDKMAFQETNDFDISI